MIEITVEDDAVIADLRGIQGRATRAAVRALNRAIVSGRAAMVKAMAADLKLASKAVRDSVPITNATEATLEARFGATLKRIPLFYFRASQTKRGATYDLGHGRSRLPHAFLAKMDSGHRGVFERFGPARLPIVEKYGPSLGHVFGRFKPEGLARTKEAFSTYFAHEYERLKAKLSEGSDV